MTAAELIEALGKFNPKSEVILAIIGREGSVVTGVSEVRDYNGSPQICSAEFTESVWGD